MLSLESAKRLMLRTYEAAKETYRIFPSQVEDYEAHRMTVCHDDCSMRSWSPAAPTRPSQILCSRCWIQATPQYFSCRTTSTTSWRCK